MLEAKADSATVAEKEVSPDAVDVDLPTQEPQTHYADAREFGLEEYDYPVPGFINELLDELGKDLAPEDARLVDTVDPSKDIDDGLLVAYPDESLMFIGKDPTAKDAMPWYAFTIEPMEPTPAPQTAKDALDLLKPPVVQDVIEDDGYIPDRHGEWWLLPSTKVPLSRTFKPGVKSRPYGPSPLGNHVPREYAFTKPVDEFMQSFHKHTESAPESIQSPPEVIKWAWKQQHKHPSVQPNDTPEWADIRAWAGDILVKGTLRHRDNDHYREKLGDQWHLAVTHRMEVYTSDAIGEGVHLDYYGQ